MKGFIFIIIIYGAVVFLCFITKYLFCLVKKNKKSDAPATQKIYYIENSAPKKRRTKISSPKIQIKGTIIEKDDFEN
ncbi:MAG: hypothetical protein IKV61_00265 [Clostridia bacterium]|nr:hypothetical protein [Clostridia bacterium]